MPPEAPAPLAAAAARRDQLTRARAIQALRELDRAGLARHLRLRRRRSPRISRSWLYTQPDIRDQIRQLRGTPSPGPASAIPASQRATDTSLRARLTATLHRNQQLAEENARLRRQLARALGDQQHHPDPIQYKSSPLKQPPNTPPPSRRGHRPPRDDAGHSPG